MPNFEGNDENVLGKGIDAIFRRTLRTFETEGHEIRFDNGDAHREGDDVIVRLHTRPTENLVSAVRKLLYAAEHGELDALTDRVAIQNEATAIARRGLQAIRQGNNGQAIESFMKSLTIIDNSDVRFNLAVAYELIGHMEEAADHYFQVVAQNPGDAEAWNNLSAMYYCMGEFEKAMDSYERGVRIRPELAHADSETLFQSKRRPRDL